MSEDVYGMVAGCIRNVMESSELEISPESRLQEDLSFDSIHILMLQVALEEIFCFRFNPMEDNFRQIFATVGSIVDYISDLV